MGEARLARLPGARPAGSDRNGMPPPGGYRFRKFEAWYPEAGRHLDPEAVAPDEGRRPGASAHDARRALERSRYEARLAEFARLMAEDPQRTQAEAAVLMGLSAATVKGYARELRERASAEGVR